VVVLGSINVDLIVNAGSLPAPGETVTGGSFSRSGGGKGANQAVAASRAGADVALVGGTGRDDFGTSARKGLGACGIDVSGVAETDEATGIALITVDPQGRNQIAVASGANSALEPEDAARLVKERTAPGSVLAMTNELEDAVNRAAIAAVPAQARLLLDPAPARRIPSEILQRGPVLTPNADEAAALTGETDPEGAARVLQALTSAPVVVTLGASGALVLADGRTTVIEARPVEVVDTTGAGDALAGTLAAAMAAGHDIVESTRLAVDAAGSSVQRSGAGWALDFD
jgi:ribokinase